MCTHAQLSAHSCLSHHSKKDKSILMPNNGETLNYGIIIKSHGIWSITAKICRIHHNLRSVGDTIEYSTLL